MAAFTACAGSGQNATGLQRYPSQQEGLGRTRAKTFGHCPVCGYTVRSFGIVQAIKVTRHKEKASDA